jgi:Polyketide cyclase / dehydrase and lipid transport
MMAGHVDVREVARAPLERVWAVASDPAEWARAGHPARDVERRGDRLRFRPASGGGLVERVEDPVRRTAYSRRVGSDEFVYCHLWFGHEEVADGTELRVVADFEMAPGAAADDAAMEAIMARALRANLAATARLAEQWE